MNRVMITKNTKIDKLEIDDATNEARVNITSLCTAPYRGLVPQYFYVKISSQRLLTENLK